MGIRSLTYLIKTKGNEHSIEEKTLKDLKGKRIAIDASLFIYQSLINIRNSGDTLKNKKGQNISHLYGIFIKTINLLNYNIIPIYVFDGKPPKEKKEIINNRKKAVEECNEKLKVETDVDKINSLKKKTVRITYEHIDEIKELLSIMGVSYIHMEGEAEGLASELCRKKYVDYVMTEDMDSLVFGCPKLIRKSIVKKNKDKDSISIFNLDSILDTFDMTHDEFINLCILCGCDYCSSIPKIGNITAFKLIKQHKNIENILEYNKLNKKYNIPDDYKDKFDISKKLFLIFKDKLDIDNLDIVSSDINKHKLDDYLSTKLDMSKKKIDNYLKTI